MMNRIHAMAAALLLATVPASASEFLTIDGSNDFGAQKQQILADLSEGKRYAEIDAGDIDKLKSALNRMEQLLGTPASVDGFGEREKVALFNDQELVNTLLTDAREDSRMVCERQKKTGSHRTESVCKSIAQRRRERESSQDYLRNRPSPVLSRDGI